MIAGLGTDMVDLDRIEAALERHGEAFLRRVFTERERALFAADRTGEPDDGTRFLQAVAARFAAKEAALKALGTGWGQGVGWHDVEVLDGRGRPPRLEFGGAAAGRLAALGATASWVSLTHTDRAAAATVVLA